MAKRFKIPAELRTDVGKGASRRLRRAGRVPAIVYGAGRDPVSITIDHQTTLHAAEEEAFHVSVLELTVDDKRQKVVVRDLQRHPFKPLLTHIDFLRVRDDQELRINVPIHFINEETSSAGKTAGVVVSYQVMEVEISALPKDLPEYLEVDLVNLEPGDSVMLSQVPLPEGVTVPQLEFGDEDSDTPVVSALFIRASQGTGEQAAEADAAAAEDAEVETVDEAEADAEEGDSEDEADAGGEADKE